MASSKKNSPSIMRMSQNQLKRQREWVYLAHFLAMLHLHPAKTISGRDDGNEPDFTCIFYCDKGEYKIGIELTTLPRLRDTLGNDNLMLKRWYWQSLLQLSTKLTPTQFNCHGEILGVKGDWQKIDNRKILNLSQQFIEPPHDLPHPTLSSKLQNGIAKTMRWLPSAFFTDMADENEDLPIDSYINQSDIDAVMSKKAHKVQAYQKKRALDEVWLLIHTNEQQEKGVLSFDTSEVLHHGSEFNRVFLTLYPTTTLLQIAQ
nr:hypothetical protein [Moraxella sp. CTOTU49097]